MPTDYERLCRAESEIELLKKEIAHLNEKLSGQEEIEQMFYNDESEGRYGGTGD